MLVGLGLRAPFVPGPLESDEAGLLLVVRHWGPDSDSLYGDYWVDRPPLLLGYFWLGDQLAGTVGVRLLGCVVSVLLVVCAAATGQLLNGRAGLWWAGLTAAALGSSYVVGAHMVNGMVQGAMLTLLSCGLTIAATRGRPGAARLYGLTLAGGAAGTAALLVKQNFFCGLVFAGVVLVASGLTGRLGRAQVAGALASAALGASGVVAAVVAWASWAGVDVRGLWFALYGFRVQALRLLGEGGMPGPPERVLTLAAAFVGSGLVLMVGLLVAAAARTFARGADRRYLAGAVALVAVSLVGIVLGGSWWRHYVVQLVPAAVLAVALLAPRRDRWGSRMRAAVAVVVLSSLGGVVGGLLAERVPPEPVRVGRYLHAATQPGDTGFVTWGTAELLLYAGLESPSPHLWSLPTRTLDPDLADLVATLRGPNAPTWIVEWHPFDSWGLDHRGQLADVVAERYRQVGSPCGRPLHLLRGVDRRLPAARPCG